MSFTNYALTDKQIATILAALRYWQEEFAPEKDNEYASPMDYIPAKFHDHFAEVEPLTEPEIDQLCEDINYYSTAFS